MDVVATSLLIPALALPVALAIDAQFGEPPAAWHPVVWMGKFLEVVGSWAAPSVDEAPLASPLHSFVKGALGWTVGAFAVVGMAWLCERAVAQLPIWAHVLLLGVCLKPLLSWAMLVTEVKAVASALNTSLSEGRDRLRWLCSRDVHQLDAVQVRETVIETLAENLNDSVVAPLFWFALLGLPGAALYRFANTADAMWGYRGECSGRYWAWAGKWAARADDVLSWVPARITAGLLVVSQGLLFLPNLRREALVTASPNGGWPMGAMALLLDVRLGKPGVYALNSSGRLASAEDVQRACGLARRAVWLCIPVCWLILGALHV
jgi:adenosylcobinamide-phosphate synthase